MQEENRGFDSLTEQTKNNLESAKLLIRAGAVPLFRIFECQMQHKGHPLVNVIQRNRLDKRFLIFPSRNGWRAPPNKSRPCSYLAFHAFYRPDKYQLHDAQAEFRQLEKHPVDRSH